MNRRSWRQILVPIECGLHSGFPKCCIAWFTACTPAMRRFEDRLKKFVGQCDRTTPYWSQAMYRQCPICILRGRWVYTKGCATEEHRWAFHKRKMEVDSKPDSNDVNCRHYYSLTLHEPSTGENRTPTTQGYLTTVVRQREGKFVSAYTYRATIIRSY